jgi:hypothetical protein
MGPEGLDLVEGDDCNALTQLAVLKQLGSDNLVIHNDLFKVNKKSPRQRSHLFFPSHFSCESHKE